MSPYVSICHRLSEVSEEKQRRKKRSKDRKNQVPVHVDLLAPSCSITTLKTTESGKRRAREQRRGRRGPSSGIANTSIEGIFFA